MPQQEEDGMQRPKDPPDDNPGILIFMVSHSPKTELETRRRDQ